MPVVREPCDTCKVSFSTNGPIADDAPDNVCAILDELKPSIVGLQQVAQLSCGQNGSKGRKRANSNRQYPPAINYMHLHACDRFYIGIFRMSPSSIIPLHNHPGMTVLSKLLYGSLHVNYMTGSIYLVILIYLKLPLLSKDFLCGNFCQRKTCLPYDHYNHLNCPRNFLIFATDATASAYPAGPHGLYLHINRICCFADDVG
ncbi:hypothetical protein DITRI_Ditri19aG0050900 [Diplodiscus trichospermus]